MLSTLIVNWNTRDLLRACLLSLREHPFSGESEVIVVDNASRDGSAEMVRAEFPEVRLLANPLNRGYAGGNNDAFAVARGDLLLTLNPDTEVRAGALDEAAACLARHPEAGAVGVRQIGLDGEVQRSVRAFPTPANIAAAVLGRGAAYRLDAFDYEKEQPAPQPMGTFLLFPRDALAKIGDPRRPFDETFPIFFNEVDLLKRLADAGRPAWYAPRAEILHHGGAGTRQNRPAMIWESHRSLLRYLRRHELGGARALATPGVALLLFGAALVRARGYHRPWRISN